MPSVPGLVGQTLQRVRLASPFLLRSVTPPAIRALKGAVSWACAGSANASSGRSTTACSSVIHLMIAGRFRWAPAAGPERRKSEGGQAPKPALAAFDFTSGTLMLTEAGAKKRASLYVVEGEAALDGT